MMKSFIHTFSFRTKIDSAEYIRLYTAYPELRYDRMTQKHLLNTYKNQGVRIEISACNDIEKRFDKEHCMNKVEIIFTPYKVLYSGKTLGYVTEEADIELVCKRITTILEEVNNKSGVDLLKRASIKRVDVTCDVETPSEAYTKEIIRIAKKVKVPYGYVVWKPSEEEIKLHKDWKEENAVFYYNHNKEIEYKIYNKRYDLEKQNENVDFLGNRGLVRFELTLKRKALRNLGYIISEQFASELLNDFLYGITVDSSQILKDYMSNTLNTGDILSKKILRKHIKNMCGSKIKKAEKMIKYIDSYTENNIYGSDKSVKAVEKEFQSLGISWIYSNKECPYIPSIEKLLGGMEVNRKLLALARNYNEKHSNMKILYWNF